MIQQVKKPKILVVDDLPANLISMRSLLKKIDGDVITADSGNEALSIAVKENLALILLDINMPEMDGFEVAEFLNVTEETKNIPIIFVTAVHHSKENIIKGYCSGAVDYVEKPITPEILISKVNSFIKLWKLKNGLEFENYLRREAEKEIQHLALHDPLTKLPNRRQLHNQLEIALDHSKRAEERLAVLFLDLDGFKKINDEFGHHTGDEVLIGVSKRFKAHVRSSDILARYGGDEFIIVLSDISESLLLTVKLGQLVADASEPFIRDDVVMQIGVSIGVSVYPDHGTTADGLISCADNAMYQAKAEGKNRFRFFSNELNKKIKRRVLVENNLRKAVEREEFEVHFQPLIETQSGITVGAELLLRWHCKELGDISPDEFIPVAESTGLISTLGIWVVQQLASAMEKWPEMNFAVNASSLQFKNNLLYLELYQLIKQGRIDPERLEIEITESLLLGESRIVNQQMDSINLLGVRFSVDDFGTGYSSLSYLKNCPVSTVKIDQSFIYEIPASKENAALIKAIIAMADALKLKVIAEGVETEEQWRFLQQHKCDLLQGYFFSKPVNKLEFTNFLEDNQKKF